MAGPAFPPNQARSSLRTAMEYGTNAIHPTRAHANTQAAAHLDVSSGQWPEEVFQAAREKVTYKCNHYSYVRRLLHAKERAHRQLDARLQYGEVRMQDVRSDGPPTFIALVGTLG